MVRGREGFVRGERSPDVQTLPSQRAGSNHRGPLSRAKMQDESVGEFGSRVDTTRLALLVVSDGDDG